MVWVVAVGLIVIAVLLYQILSCLSHLSKQASVVSTQIMEVARLISLTGKEVRAAKEEAREPFRSIPQQP